MNRTNLKSYRWDDRTILIVEDDASSIFFLEEVLNNTGVKILVEKNGTAAIEECRSNNEIDLVLMDIQLPEMDGCMATEEIKKLKPDLPVIAQTAYALTDDRKKCLQAGCDDYISKPIDPLKLLKLIESYLD